MLSVVILGTGNLAQHLCEAFSKAKKVDLKQVFGRNPDKLQPFKAYAQTCSLPKEIEEADVYLIVVKDGAIEEVASLLAHKKGLVVHTAGAVGMDILKMENRGVFYPMQTFTKGKSVDFQAIPICVEAHRMDSLKMLKLLASSISQKVHELSSDQRKYLHLAAVFTNNFTNHLYGISENICEQNNIPFELLKPLILETASKIQDISPFDAQTGPARRGDYESMEHHLNLITNNFEREIYTLFSDAIKSKYEEEL